MDPPNGDGPDASSLKPVSSLRARFENMSKPGTETPNAPTPSLPVVPGRSLSPGSKPERLREAGTPIPLSNRHSMGPPVKPKPWESSAPSHQSPFSSHVSLGSVSDHSSATVASDSPAPSSNRLSTAFRQERPPPISPRPVAPPSLLVQPPQSPPKGRAGNATPGGAEQSNLFLNPDSIAKNPVSPSSSPRPVKVPSRPHTPTHSPSLDLGRSPLSSPSRPPSPPPPRRSAELKRERSLRDLSPQQRPVAAPPIKRADKPKIPSQQLGIAPPSVSPQPRSPVPRSPGPGERVAPTPSPTRPMSYVERRSPFSTPPSGPEDVDEELPPELPTRPPQRPHAERAVSMLPPPRPKPTPVAFDPPPVHHSIATRRLERDQETTARGLVVSSQVAGPVSVVSNEAPPPLPMRPQAVSQQLPPRQQIPASQPPPQRQQIPASQPPPQRQQIPATTRYPPRASRQILASDSNGANGSNGNVGAGGLGTSQMLPPPKRVLSNPTTTTTTTTTVKPPQQQTQYPPPPHRSRHGRSMTLDRGTAKFSHDARTSTQALIVANRGPTSGGIGSSSARGGLGSSIPPQETIVPLSSAPVTVKLTDTATGLPDPTHANRRAPYIKQSVAEINTRYDCRLLDVCGDKVVTTGHQTRVWSLRDGELLMSLPHDENLRATAVAFKPGAHVDDEGLRVWIGNSVGELIEADIATQSRVASKPNAHNRHEIIKIYRHFNELWTLCDGGSLYVWGPAEDGTNAPSLAGTQHQSFRVPRGHTFSMVVGDELWLAAGKEVRVFLPSLDGKAQFQVLMRALVQENAGEVSAGTVLLTDPDRVFLGHTDGKVSIYSRTDHTCVGLVSLGSYKINTLASAGAFVWAGYNTGRVAVYDTAQTPWAVQKEWIAHDQPVVRLVANRSSAYQLQHDALHVVSLGADNLLRVWDGLLAEDWLEEQMQAQDATYCGFETLRAQVMTWNAGASTPHSLRYAEDDAQFLPRLLQSSDRPHILVFGFQELVDLEDKTATAKRLLKGNKKKHDGGGGGGSGSGDQERMSHQYRDWRDFLVRSLDDAMEGEIYHLLQTAHMVGLFTCVFVRSDMRDRIRNVATTEIKRGMGGLHGNKGALVVRFLVDDSSVCFVNCHLAAGQTQAAHRHNDVAAILESTGLPAERDAEARVDLYRGGGDGTMILDHELCVLGGDLNYRIDTMSRDTVVAAVRAGNLAKLLDRDQLLVARRRNAGFRLRAFEEQPIAFAPTYKYDVGSDAYDTSEKKRSPAWCDRLLFRGGRAGRVQQLDYRRHEVRVSDHRPVTGRFAMTVKRVDAQRRAVAWAECQKRLLAYKAQVADDERMYYLTHIIGYDEATSRELIQGLEA